MTEIRAARVLLDAYADEPDWGTVEGRYRKHEAPKAFAALRAVLDLHASHRIYTECDHEHTEEEVEDERAIEVSDIGYTCEDGYLYSVCGACCFDDDNKQTEECTSHSHGDDKPLCPTEAVIVAALED